MIVNTTFWPTLCVGLSTSLVTDRSATVGVTTSESRSSSAVGALPGVESGSNWLQAVTSAVLVFAPIVAVVAVIVSVAVPPLTTVPTVHTPVPLT